MLNYVQAIVLGGLQGLTELFPISSLGHTVIFPQLFGWSVDQGSEFFVVFLVATHVATALVLLGFFWREWLNIIKGFFRTLSARRVPAGDTHARLAWLIIIATIPAGLLGILLDARFEELFAAPILVAFFLIGNGFLLYGAEILRKRRTLAVPHHDLNAAIVKLTYLQALGVGAMQALALFPGFSRTGSALAGGLLSRLDHESAVRFSFLLATPLILAAGVLKLPKLLHAPHEFVLPVLVGSLASALMAFLAVRFLTRYFKTNTLTPFAIYCVLAGIVALFVLQ